MRKLYVTPAVEVIEFDTKDVITTSSGEVANDPLKDTIDFGEWSDFK